MNLLVLGGRSEIGLAIAKRLAPEKVVLAARRSTELDAEEQALRAAGAGTVTRAEFDADAVGEHEELLTGLSERHGPFDVVVLAFGILGDQQRAEREAEHALAITHTDYVAQISVLTHLANLLRARGSEKQGSEKQGSGTMVVFSSVAGIRVRRANYVYGAAKAGLDGFANGLADALHGSGARLLLVRPGYVHGRMAAAVDPAPFSSTPDQVAAATVTALRKGKRLVWVPPVLRLVFGLLRFVPQSIWRRMPR